LIVIKELLILTDGAGHVWGVTLCGHIRQETLHGWQNILWCRWILASMSTITVQVSSPSFYNVVHRNTKC